MADAGAQEEGTDIRRKAAARLGIAALVTGLALASLWWLDRSGKEAPKPRPAAPSPIVSAPVAVPPPPPAAPSETADQDAAQPPAEAQAAEQQAPATPPPAPVVGAPMAPAPARPAHVAAPSAVTAPAAATAAAGDYVVQLGVFSNPRNARDLVARLQKKGIHAYTETRVQVGPFKDKAEAERVQAELKGMGISGLVGTTK